ncbi:hypothetical protein [Natronococcus wangiae]|uniref:hypothetical protein n=1 Tax=Natronococcus wangiae TaxID=3068275 RepID=UPI00273FBB0E|nr:hypothetical protein [Natronococcus sp. AD5]
MISRENAAILGSFALLVLVLAGFSALQRLGVPVGDYPLVGFLVAVGVAIVLPQLYLARTDDEVAPRTRLWLAAILSGLFAIAFVTEPNGFKDALVLGVAGGALLVVCWYEARAAYRDAMANGDSASRS